MRTIAVIFNGIRLPYHVIDYAISKAKKNTSGIYAIFLQGKHEPPKGYVYPSDLGTTENWTSDEDAVKDDEKIILDNMELVRKMVANEKIPYRSTLKTNASADEVIALSATSDLIVIDENFDEMVLLGDDKISLEILRDKIDGPVDIVPEK